MGHMESGRECAGLRSLRGGIFELKLVGDKLARTAVDPGMKTTCKQQGSGVPQCMIGILSYPRCCTFSRQSGSNGTPETPRSPRDKHPRHLPLPFDIGSRINARGGPARGAGRAARAPGVTLPPVAAPCAAAAYSSTSASAAANGVWVTPSSENSGVESIEISAGDATPRSTDADGTLKMGANVRQVRR